MEIPALHQPTRTIWSLDLYPTYEMQRQRKLQFLQSIKKGVNYETPRIQIVMIWGRMSRRGDFMIFYETEIGGLRIFGYDVRFRISLSILGN